MAEKDEIRSGEVVKVLLCEKKWTIYKVRSRIKKVNFEKLYNERSAHHFGGKQIAPVQEQLY